VAAVRRVGRLLQRNLRCDRYHARLLTSMIGSTIREVVTATNSSGSTSATSESTSVIKALLPSNTGLPSIVGSLIDGSALTGAKGSWTGSEPSFSYQWLLCNSSGAACKEISGATGTTLGLLKGMIGSTHATGRDGNERRRFDVGDLGTDERWFKALLPSNTGLPTALGSLIDGSALTGAVGAWSGSEPLSFSRQWLLCDFLGRLVQRNLGRDRQHAGSSDGHDRIDRSRGRNGDKQRGLDVGDFGTDERDQSAAAVEHGVAEHCEARWWMARR